MGENNSPDDEERPYKRRTILASSAALAGTAALGSASASGEVETADCNRCVDDCDECSWWETCCENLGEDNFFCVAAFTGCDPYDPA